MTGSELRPLLKDLVVQERARGGMAVINAILDHPQALQLLGAMEPEELHLLMVDIGYDDCHDLIRFASPTQWQGLVDLDCWAGDHFFPARIEALMGLAHSADRQALEIFFSALDDEVLVLYLRHRARIVARTFEPEQDDELDTLEAEIFRTPDELFYIILPPEDNQFAAVRTFIDLLYERDHLDAAALLKHAIAEDTDQLEEEALQFRNARVSTMGFPTMAEAEELLEYINPVQVRTRLNLELPEMAPYVMATESLLPVLENSLPYGPDFLVQALELQDDDKARERVNEAVIYAANTVVVLMGKGDLADGSAREAGLKRALALISLGLEYLADENPDRAAQLLRKVWPRTLFRVGHSLLIPLAQTARVCSSATPGFFLFDPPLDGAIRAALADTPLYFTGIDGDVQPRLRDISSMRDLTRMHVTLKQARTIQEFMHATILEGNPPLLDLVPEPRRQYVTHTTLMTTALVNALRGEPELLTALSYDAFPEIFASLFVSSKSGDKLEFLPQVKNAVIRFTKTAQSPFVAALFELSMKKLEAYAQRYPGGIAPDPKYAWPMLLLGK